MNKGASYQIENETPEPSPCLILYEKEFNLHICILFTKVIV
jgi:hypothetical protein